MGYIKDISGLTLNDLLTVDTHGESINICGNSANSPYELIPSRSVFFGENGLFSEVKNKGITIIKHNDKIQKNIDEFLNDLNSESRSSVVLIEGFAGCGKSTLVQYILSNQLENYEYDYNFYNYDLEAQNDINTRDSKGNIIQRSSIYNAIKKSFFEQFLMKSKENRQIINDFNKLLLYCKDFQPFNDLYYFFYNTDTYDTIIQYLNNNQGNQDDVIIRNLVIQSNQINSSSCVLALDYLLRLAMYKNNKIKKLYICYDNLDSIEDAEDLRGFDDNLVKFRGFIDDFIIFVSKKNFFNNCPIPHFVIMATYRKITASLANIAYASYKEVSTDKNSTPNKNYIIHIDATSAFQYSSIVSKRKKYFTIYFANHPIISRHLREGLMDSFDSWDKLNQNLKIMEDRYACLWNKNYRTCSLIANELYTNSDYNFNKCVDFIRNSNIHDGYQTVKDEDGNSVLCTYYGSSAILLSCVCKVFNTHNIWSDFLYLAPLCYDNSTNKNTLYDKVSLSRLILTYIYNSSKPVSLKELFVEFCEDELFDYSKLCKILSKMLARNLDGVWRRPIYYVDKCILSEIDTDIENVLLDECKQYVKNKTMNEEYTFLLCDSGIAYVERLMQEFEFYSNRLNNRNKALYLYNKVDDIKKVITSVYNAVSDCCNNMIEFADKYRSLRNISNEEYLTLPIHPKTSNKHSPQLHTERTIFSHISYLNNVRKYFLDKETTPDFSERKKYNSCFVELIKQYLDLYYSKIVEITDMRKKVADSLLEIVNEINEAIENKNDDEKIIFKSISL